MAEKKYRSGKMAAGEANLEAAKGRLIDLLPGILNTLPHGSQPRPGALLNEDIVAVFALIADLVEERLSRHASQRINHRDLYIAKKAERILTRPILPQNVHAYNERLAVAGIKIISTEASYAPEGGGRQYSRLSIDPQSLAEFYELVRERELLSKLQLLEGLDAQERHALRKFDSRGRPHPILSLEHVTDKDLADWAQGIRVPGSLGEAYESPLPVGVPLRGGTVIKDKGKNPYDMRKEKSGAPDVTVESMKELLNQWFSPAQLLVAARFYQLRQLLDLPGALTNAPSSKESITTVSLPTAALEGYRTLLTEAGITVIVARPVDGEKTVLEINPGDLASFFRTMQQSGVIQTFMEFDKRLPEKEAEWLMHWPLTGTVATKQNQPHYIAYLGGITPEMLIVMEASAAKIARAKSRLPGNAPQGGSERPR